MGKGKKQLCEVETEVIPEDEIISEELVAVEDFAELVQQKDRTRAQSRQVLTNDDAIFFTNRILQGKDESLPKRRPGEKDGEYKLRVEIFRTAQEAILGHRRAKKMSEESYDFGEPPARKPSTTQGKKRS